ncbi:MAG: helix-turn-helix domain-containing protein [Planctomycetota bacterium]|jgi:DNA-binding transcriptional MerR regulator
MARKRLPEKLYRIGEVIEHSGLSRQTLHFYATIGLIREKKRTLSGYRLFPPSVFAALDRIRALKKKGYTLRQIREKLERRHTPRPSAAANTIRPQRASRGPDGEGR